MSAMADVEILVDELLAKGIPLNEAIAQAVTEVKNERDARW